MTRRFPYWLSPTELNDLINFLAKDNISNNEDIIEGIRNEIGVAKLRAENTHIKMKDLILVLGLEDGSLPIHLSEEEVTLLRDSSLLPPSVRKKLL